MGYAGADIAVFGEDHDLLMLVEVTGKDSTNVEWAAEVRDDALQDRRRVPEFFLVVARDAMYFWKDSRPAGSKPDTVLPPAAVLSSYLQTVKRDIHEMRSLELLVGIWLQDLTNGTAPSNATEPLDELGLAEALANGRIQFLAVA